MQKSPDEAKRTSGSKGLLLIIILGLILIAAWLVADWSLNSEDAIVLLGEHRSQVGSLQPLDGQSVDGEIRLSVYESPGGREASTVPDLILSAVDGSELADIAVQPGAFWDTRTVPNGDYSVSLGGNALDGDAGALEATITINNPKSAASQSDETSIEPSDGVQPSSPPPAEEQLRSILTADFENIDLGPVGEDEFRAAFNDPGLGHLKAKRDAAEVVREDGNKVLQLSYDAGESFPGHQAEIILPPVRKAILEYRFKFDSSFNVNFNGKSVGGKFPGLGAVGNSTAYVEGFIKPPMHCVENVAENDGWSARHMWHKGGGMHQYLYYADRSNNCGDTNFFYGNKRGTGWLETDRWYELKQEVNLDEGSIVTYLDGQQVAETRDFAFNEQPINRLIWHVYINKPGPETAAKIYFDDVRVRGV